MQTRHDGPSAASQEQPPTKRRRITSDETSEVVSVPSPSVASVSQSRVCHAAATSNAALEALTNNMLGFASRVIPSSSEVELKQGFIQAVNTCVSVAFVGYPGAKLEVFGSFAMGLSLHDSDIDACVTGIVAPDPTVGFYKSPAAKQEVNSYLNKLETHLRKLNCLRGGNILRIRRSRIPIAKVTTGSGLEMDISVSDDYGSRVVHFMREKMEQYPALKPLILVLKAWLKSQHLMEVQHGGLGGYSLYNMVIAHLQMEDKSRAKQQSEPKCLGQLLKDFFVRFGPGFDCDTHAVSVRDGGIVPRTKIKMPASEYDTKLCVVCPIKGWDIAGGTFIIPDIQSAFARASTTLDRTLKLRLLESTAQPYPYLEQLFSTRDALQRAPGRPTYY